MSARGLLENYDQVRLTAKRRRMELVVQAFFQRGMNTTAIAQDLQITEQEVCDLLEDAHRAGW
ncbi:hypothetical protein ACQ3G6_17470 [Allorhizobium undicola]|uniref:hypothetical protein n=1 Tax=Allorhizobium undicola TaxID=78527 RepID=UPI003D3382BE